MAKAGWKSEVIDKGADTFFFRKVFVDDLDRLNKHKPLPKCFLEDPDGLSLYWGKYATTPELVLAHVGVSHKREKPGKPREFKDPSKNEVFRLHYTAMEKTGVVDRINHTPSDRGNPWPLGSPSNRSHSSLQYKNAPSNEEMRRKMCGIAKIQNCRNVDRLIEELKGSRKAFI